MFCEAYNQSLRDAATSGEVLAPAQQQHLASCESCRVTFAEEQSLFAAIDSGLRAVSNSEVPATLIPRVHVALNNEPAPKRRGFALPMWGFAGAAATAAVIFALFHLPYRHPSSPIESARVSPPSIAASASPPPPSGVNSSSHGGVSQLQHERPIVVVASRGPKPKSPEVLVPDEERVAFAQFMAHASPSPTNISARATLVPRAPQEIVEISRVEIASLEVRPLDPKEGRQGQF